MSDNKTIDWPADHEEENVGLRAENQDLKTDLQYVREENELLKERNAVLLLTMKEYFRTSIDIYSPEAKQAEESAKRLLEKYAAL